MPNTAFNHLHGDPVKHSWQASDRAPKTIHSHVMSGLHVMRYRYAALHGGQSRTKKSVTPTFLQKGQNAKPLVRGVRGKKKGLVDVRLIQTNEHNATEKAARHYKPRPPRIRLSPFCQW